MTLAANALGELPLAADRKAGSTPPVRRLIAKADQPEQPEAR
jgi:hypothetical protein